MKKPFPIIPCIFLLIITLLPGVGYSQTWQSLNLVQGSADVKDLTVGRAATATYQTLYEIEGSTIYRSTDGASSWSPTSSISGSGWDHKFIACMPSDPTKLAIASTSTSGGSVHWSTNSGDNWSYSDIFMDPGVSPNALASSIQSSGNMLLGTQKVAGASSLRRSTNAGQTWQGISDFSGEQGTFNTHITAVNWHLTDQSKALAGGTLLTHQGVFYSTNTGDNWYRSGNNLSNKNVVSIALYTTDGGTTYGLAATVSAGTYGLYRNSNPYSSSSVWTSIANFWGTCPITDLRVDINKRLFATSATGVYFSSDNGNTWSACINANFTDQRDFKRIGIDPQSASTVFSGSSHNLFKSTTGGSTWRETPPTTVPVSANVLAVSGSVLLGGSPSFSQIERSTGAGWYPVATDACLNDFVANELSFSSSAGGTAFAAGYRRGANWETDQYAVLLRSTNGGDYNSWSAVDNGYPCPAESKFNGITVDPVNTNRLYLYGLGWSNTINDPTKAPHNFSISTSVGAGWNHVAVPNSTDDNVPEISCVVADPTNHGSNTYSLYIYASVLTGESGDIGIWRSTDGGNSWSSRIFTEQTLTMGFNPNQPTAMYAASYSSENGYKFWKGSPNPWTWSERPLGAGMSGNIRKILMHPSWPSSERHFYVMDKPAAGETKIFHTSDAGTSWEEVSTSGMSGTIKSLSRDLSNNTYIYVATTDGLYKLNPRPDKPNAWVTCYCQPGADCDGGGGEGGLDGGMESTDGGAGTDAIDPPACYAQVMWGNMESDASSVKIWKSTDNVNFGLAASVSALLSYWRDYTVRMPSATIYYYKVSVVDAGGNESERSSSVSTGAGKASIPVGGIPAVFELAQNAPNPFNPSTRITFSLGASDRVTLKLYDMLGKEVRTLLDEYRDAGSHEIQLNAADLPSGVYLYRIQSGRYSAVKRMVLIK